MLDVYFKILNIESLQQFRVKCDLGNICVPRQYNDLYPFYTYEIRNIGYSDIPTNQWLKSGSQPWLFATSHNFNGRADYYDFSEERLSAEAEAPNFVRGFLSHDLDYDITRVVAFLSGDNRLSSNDPVVSKYNEFLSSIEKLKSPEKIQKSIAFFSNAKKYDIDDNGNRVITGFTYFNRYQNALTMRLNLKVSEDDISKVSQFTLLSEN